MIPAIEIKKLKRTGYVPAFLAGAAAAGAFPVLNMAVRSESYTSLTGNPLSILLEANWQMMAMLNILLIVCGACMMYHTEYENNGSQRMELLPVRPLSLFLGKFFITLLLTGAVLLIEFAVLSGCALHWFPAKGLSLSEILCHLGFSLALLMPTVILMLAIAAACRNMWISLGIGVILVFTFSILPQDYLFFALCPFSSPYQLLDRVREAGHTGLFLGTVAAETLLFTAFEYIYLKIRRCFS